MLSCCWCCIQSAYLDVDGDEGVLDGDDEALVPHGIEVLVDSLALVRRLVRPPQEELDVGVGEPVGVLGGQVVALLQVHVQQVERVRLQRRYVLRRLWRDPVNVGYLTEDAIP